MIVEHLPDGRTLVDAQALQAILGRPVSTVWAHCTPVAHRVRDGHRHRVALFDADDCAQALAGVARRPRRVALRRPRGLL